MRNLNNVEANCVLLLKELEQALMKGEYLNTTIVVQMNTLKKAIQDENEKLGVDLEQMYTAYKKITGQ